MSMGKKFLLRVCAFCSLILIMVLLFFITASPKLQPLGKLDLSNVQDGEYIGECDNRAVKVTVAVRTENHRITDIQILRHNNGMGKKAEEITSRVIEAQSINIDAVSGATFSSNTILKAVENALEGAGE